MSSSSTSGSTIDSSSSALAPAEPATISSGGSVPSSPDKKRARPSPAISGSPPAVAAGMANLLLRPPPSAAVAAAEAGAAPAAAAAEPVIKRDAGIHLTEHEARLFELLKGAAAVQGKGTVLRVAGGWVRDKLLGRDSDDVDVALDNVSGAAFAEALNQYLRDQGLETRGIGVIQANPNQSKHLETARVLILGQWVDFTNLRTETYRADSRIPEIAFGTAEEDAFRRDFTINAMFYNLHTGAVEDFTGKGLADLLGPGGVIRTPLPALTTFLDDPLRLLRAIRFSARFALSLAQPIIGAAGDASLRRALGEKVSRERVGIELDGMLGGKDARPALAVEALAALGLADVTFLFHVPAEARAAILREQQEEEEECGGDGGGGWMALGVEGVRAANLLLWRREAAAAAEPSGTLAAALEAAAGDEDEAWTRLAEEDGYRRPRREHRLLFLAAALLGLAGRSAADAKGKAVPLTSFVVRESLKLRARDAEEVALLHGALPRFEALSRAGGGGASRLDAGLLLRDVKDLWRTGLDLACVHELARRRVARRRRRRRPPPGDGQSTEVESSEPETAAAVVARYERAAARVEGMGLEGVWQLKPLLDGKALIGELGLPRGPAVGQVMSEQVRWQIEHPEGTKAEAVAHLKAFAAAALDGQAK